MSSAQQAALLATGAVTSHRRGRSWTWARSASVLALGVLAAGAVITATDIPWFQEAALPRSRSQEPAATPGDHPDARPATQPDARPGASGPTPAPAAVAEPAASSRTPQASPPTLWRADEPGAFKSTPWNSVGAAPPLVDRGRVAVHLTGRGQRSELEPDLPAIAEGDQHDVTFSVCLGGDFPVDVPGRQVIARWENDSPGPAPLDLRVRDGHLVLHGGEGHPSGWRVFDRSLGPVPTGTWVKVGLRVHFSANPDRARVSAWRDGEPVLTDHHPPAGTLYPGQQSYLLVGLHRDASIAHPAAVHFRDVRIAQARVASHPDRRVHPSGTRDATSIPQQRSSSSSTSSSSTSSASTPQHRAAERSSTSSALAPQHRSSEHRSAESTASRTSSHGSVPRNTPSHVAAGHSGSTGSRR
jgi:hypothetical protein